MMTGRKHVAAIFACAVSVGLAGCAVSTSGTGSSTVQSGGAVVLHGSVHGGQQPVTGATLQLYAAGSSGYGSASTALIPSGSYYLGGAPGCVASGTQTCYSSVVTDTSGNFTITNDYSCPTSTTPVYLVARGGNPGLTSGTNNAGIGLMAALGPCGQLSSSTNVQMNELTTVASVWALSPFMTGAAGVGTSSTNALGLTNAFAAVNKLVNIATGVVGGPALPSNATLPVAKINTLGDILAACINTSGGTAGDTTSCGKLFTVATVGSSAPADTITAAMNIAQHPGVNVSALFLLSSSQSPFQTTLSTAPTDWSMVVTYTGGGLSAPKGVAADQSGNVWVSNSGNNSVSLFNTVGAAQSGSSGITAGPMNVPWGIAIDLGGNAWVANSGNSTVTEIVAAATSGTVFSGGGLSTPHALAVDGSGNVWVGNYGNGSVTEISTAQVLTNTTGAGIGAATGIAIGSR